MTLPSPWWMCVVMLICVRWCVYVCVSRDMGLAADVPIEPALQKEKADATMRLNGVMCCGVPGGTGAAESSSSCCCCCR